MLRALFLVETCMFGASDKLKIVGGVVSGVFVFVMKKIARRNWTVNLFPLYSILVSVLSIVAGASSSFAFAMARSPSVRFSRITTAIPAVIMQATPWTLSSVGCAIGNSALSSFGIVTE